MAKVTGKYETVFIVTPTINEDETAAVVAKFKALVEQNATNISVDEWGKRRLAYPINDLNEGFYVLINFESKPEFPAELDRIYKITDTILRSLIICKDE